MVQAVTVFCSSSTKVAQVYLDAARELGRAIAREGWTLVYGGNAIGSMDYLSKGAREEKGKVIGVTPRIFIDQGVHDVECELVLAESMRHRKQVMEERGDAFVTLPGGLGTLEEIFEIIVGRQLGFHDKPIVLLNVEGFFEPLLAMIDKGVEQGFVREKARSLYFVTKSVRETIEYLRNGQGPMANQ